MTSTEPLILRRYRSLQRLHHLRDPLVRPTLPPCPFVQLLTPTLQYSGAFLGHFVLTRQFDLSGGAGEEEDVRGLSCH